MDDFKKQAQEARLARMQGVRISRPDAPRRNRIEEALGQAPAAPTYTPLGTMPVLHKPEPHAPTTNETPKANRTYGRFLQKFFLGLVVIVLVAIVGLGGYAAFNDYKHPKELTSEQLIAEVGKLVALPQGETPTVATISDLKPLEGQEFFKDAQIGDKVLIFGTSKKAVLYRPSEKKVITVAPLDATPTSNP